MFRHISMWLGTVSPSKALATSVMRGLWGTFAQTTCNIVGCNSQATAMGVHANTGWAIGVCDRHKRWLRVVS